MIEFDKIEKKMEKVRDNFYKTNEKVNNKIQEAKEKKKSGDLAPNKYEEVVNAEEAARQAERESAINSLNKVYEEAEQQLKGQVGFGESNPAAVNTILNNFDDLGKSERKVIAENWKNAGNYIGMKALREKDVISAGDFKDIDEQKEKLKSMKESKLQVIQSKGNYSSRLDRMEKLGGLK